MTRPAKKRMTQNPKISSDKSEKKPKETDVAALFEIACWRGGEKRRRCKHLRGGVCRFHTWRSRKEILQSAGNPVQNQGSKAGWSVEPSYLWCAFCPTGPELQEIDEYIEEIYEQLDELRRWKSDKQK